jgi:hypothetical protein
MQQVVPCVLLSAYEVVNHQLVFRHYVLPDLQQSAAKNFFLRRLAQ